MLVRVPEDFFSRDVLGHQLGQNLILKSGSFSPDTRCVPVRLGGLSALA
jgi:hypothetical protein